MDSLTKLQFYYDSDDEENKVEKLERLPVPEFCLDGSDIKSSQKEENHDHKIRNFPHEPGNWATYVYLPLDSPSEFSHFLEKTIKFFQPLNLYQVDDFHISLTRTVVLKHHWIRGFIESIRNSLTDINHFKIYLSGLKTYVNEQKTRTFLSLEVSEGKENLKTVVNRLDGCLAEYNLLPFYKNPSFHLSLLWCMGDRSCEINQFLDKLPLKLESFGFSVDASHCICTSGNKNFSFQFI